MGRELPWTTKDRLTRDQMSAQVLLAKDGDIEAQHRVVESLFGLAIHLVKGYLASGEDAHDLFHEAVLGAYNALSRYNSDNTTNTHFVSYAYCLMRFRLWDYVHKQNDITKRVFYEHEMDEEIGPIISNGVKTVHMDFEPEEAADLVYTAIDRLPSREREIALLHLRERKIFKEIGQMMGITTSRVHQLWDRGLKLLKPIAREMMDV